MDSLIKELEKPKRFDVFVQEQMKNSTYKPLWKDEIATIDYEASRTYRAAIAEYSAAMVGSVIDKNGEKPTHTMPSANELVGSISHMGDEWQMDNDRLDQYYYMEGRLRNKYGNDTPAMYASNDYAKLVKYLFDPFEKAVIAPQKRIDLLYYEGLFSGTQTVDAKNNKKSNVTYKIDLGVKKYHPTAKWGGETSSPISDIQRIVDELSAKGKTVVKMRMSTRTFRKMCKSKEFADTFKLKLGKVDISPAKITFNEANLYLESLLLPTITIEPDRFVKLQDGSTINMTVDDRVVFQCVQNVAVLKVSDPLEMIDPLPNKTYSQYDDALVGFWRNEKGRFIDYEMWATPVFYGLDDFFIMETDKTA